MHPAKGGGQPTVATVTVQHGITGVVAVFHRQTAGPVQPTLRQGSGIFWHRDTEAQFGTASRRRRPRGKQTSFTVINKGDVDGAWLNRGVVVALQGVG